MANTDTQNLPAAQTPLAPSDTVVMNDSGGNTAIATIAAVGAAIVTNANLVSAPFGVTNGNIATLNSSGQLVDSQKRFNDGTPTTQNIWSALQTQTAITQGLLNAPSLPVVDFATVANDTLTGLAARGTEFTPTANSIVLVKNQTNNDNSFYRATAGAWVRQKFSGGVWADIVSGTDILYSSLGIQGGIVNVRGGATNQNLQFQINIVNNNVTFGNSIVYVTQTTEIPLSNNRNIYADADVGNNSFNGSQSFPLRTLSAVYGAITATPATVNLSGSTFYTDAVSWGKVNVTIQGNNLSSNGGLQTITARQTFPSGSRYIHFANTNHSTGATSPFLFASGALCSNEFKNITVSTTAPDWLGLNSGCQNWIRLNNISFATPGLNAINLPAFTNAFTIYIDKQDTFCGPIIFTGTGAANTTIVIAAGVAEGNVRVSTGFLGTVLTQQPFTSRTGSFQHPVGIITNQTDLTNVLTHTASTGFDGSYAITGFNPTSFSRGAIIGKQTLAGVATSVFFTRQFAFAPGSIQDYSGVTYTPSAIGADWSIFAAGPPTIPSYTMSARPAADNTIGFNSTVGIIEELNTSVGVIPLSSVVCQGVLTVAVPTPTSAGLWLNQTGAAINGVNQSAVGYWSGLAWTVCYEFANLEASIVAGGVTYNKSASDWVEAGTGSGVVAAAQYAKFTCAPQTSQPISVGYRIVFNSTEAQAGTDITLTNGGNQININPSVPGTLYRVRSSHGIAYAFAGPAFVQSSILEIASQNYQGSKSLTNATSRVSNIAYNADGAECTITANSLIAITLMITYNENGTVLGYDASQGTDQQPWIEIEAIAAPYVVPTIKTYAFRVYGTNGQPISAGINKIIMAGKTFDDDNVFSLGGSWFVAPVDGIYRFEYGVRKDNSGDYIAAQVHVNGTDVSEAPISPITTPSSTYASASSCSVYLAAGDQVTLNVFAGANTTAITSMTTSGGRTYGAETFLSGSLLEAK